MGTGSARLHAFPGCRLSTVPVLSDEHRLRGRRAFLAGFPVRNGRRWAPCAVAGALLVACVAKDDHAPPSGSSAFNDAGTAGALDVDGSSSGSGAARGTGGTGKAGTGGKLGVGGAAVGGTGGAGAESADAGSGAGGDIGAGGGNPGSGGSFGSGGRASGGGTGGQVGTGPTDSGPPPELPDGFVCAPPFVCTPPGTGGSIAVSSCAGMDVVLDTHGMQATGPTSAFADAYNAALASHAAGPFVVHLTSTVVDVNYERALVAGAKPGTGGKVSLTEKPVDYLYSGAQTRMILVPGDLVGFHLAFDTSQNAAGSVAVVGLNMDGTMNTACTSLENASASLYISESQASVSFGSSTLGALLGEKNTDLGGTGTDDGWVISLSGTASKVVVQ